MKKKLKITVLMDEACLPEDAANFNSCAEHNSTEYNVVKALNKLGYTCNLLGVGKRIEPIVQSLTQNRPDLVFNLAEQYRDDRKLDNNVAALLELMDIPFTGTGSAGLMLCRNKGICKQILSTRKIRVPGFNVFIPGRVVRVSKSMRFPLVIKPIYEDGSDGISNASLVKNEPELKERVSLVHQRWNQPAIAEEFIDGRELYVGLLGNKKLKVLPVRELHFGEQNSGGPVMATYHAKWNKEYQKKWNLKFGFGELLEPVAKNIEKVCRKVFRLLQIQDYGRIDLRLTPDNNVFVLEANPNPGIDREEEMALAASKAGIDYINFIENIVRLAFNRYFK